MSYLSKQELRESMLAQRRALRPADHGRWSESIAVRLREVREFQEASVVLSYVSGKDNEAETREIISELLAAGRAVWVPRVAPERRLDWFRIRDWADLSPGRFGILEPAVGAPEPLPPPAHAVCLTPGIAFTREGYRIGYGGGYFDRFLEGFPGTAIGLAFECQFVGTFPRDDYDRRVDIVVTEAAVYRCG
jgi:5-formyltetrahydrofolate cyclo-ligase